MLNKLRGFAIATDRIVTERGAGSYHLIVIRLCEEGQSTLTPFPLARLEDADTAYLQIEERAKAGEPIEAVLVSAGPIDALRKAYPNYFLDTKVFIDQLRRIMKVSQRF